MSALTTDKRLLPFCETVSDSTYNLETPWVSDGWVYATDGHIIVRVKAKKCDSTKGEATNRPAGLHELFVDFPRNMKSAWPDTPPENLPCPCCRRAAQRHPAGASRIGGIIISDAMFSLVRTLSDVRYAYRNTDSLWFRAEGGIQGIVMGMYE